MKLINSLVLDLTVTILDYLYKGRDYQRFWVLEEIARAPYFAFLSVLHLRESMGLRGAAQSVNETEHLEYMESKGGNRYWVDRFVAKHLVLVYYWINVFYYWVAPRSAYHLSYEVEIHAAETYGKYLAFNGPDEKILEILNDELNHSRELKLAMEKI